MATLAAILPGVVLGPFAGALVDRWNRRIVMMMADGFVALATLGLAALYAAGAMQLWHVYVIMFLRAIGGSFHWPAMQASTSLMVPEQHLSRVAGLNQTMQGALNIIAPPLGAVLLGVLPLHEIMLVDVVTAMLAIAPLLFVRIPQPKRGEAAPTSGGLASVWSDVREGFRYIWSWPGMMLLGAIAAVLNFLYNPAFSLTPILVTQHFHGQALQLAWMESAWSVGMVMGGLTLGVWGGFRRRMLTSLMGLILQGIGTLLIGLTPSWAFGLALGSMFTTGFMNVLVNGPIFAMLQAKVAPDMQGRVFTLVGSVAGAMAPLGMIIAGPAADALGVQFWFVLAGAVCVVMATVAFFVPALMHLDDTNGHVASEATRTVLVGAASVQAE
jgi:DHA3 family macrolide efflux protein-like MFS transporter